MKAKRIQMTNDKQLVAPLVHLNGSGKQTLSNQYNAAITACSELMKALRDTAPHMRDFYPWEDADEAFRLAEEQWVDRSMRVRAVQDELYALVLSLD